MRIRTVAVAGSAAVALALSGCAPGTDGTGMPQPSATPTEIPAELVLPEDAVLGLVGIATAGNGATADLAVVVHATLPYLVPEAEDATDATLAWCTGEVDEEVLVGRGFSFTAVDVTLTPRDGDWPADLALTVYPTPNPVVGSTIAVDAGLRQVDASDDDSLGDAVPHCLQPAVLDGTGSGTAYLGIPNDIAGVEGLEPFTAWTLHEFGVSAILPGELGESDVTFSSCSYALTPLGEEFGAADPTDWVETFEATGCRVGAPVLE